LLGEGELDVLYVLNAAVGILFIKLHHLLYRNYFRKEQCEEVLHVHVAQAKIIVVFELLLDQELVHDCLHLLLLVGSHVTLLHLELRLDSVARWRRCSIRTKFDDRL